MNYPVHFGLQFQCNKCDKKFKRKDKLKRHLESVHGGNQFDCNKCDKFFQDKTSLLRHVEVHSLKEQGLKLSCEECKRTYRSREAYNFHLKTNHNGRKIEPQMILDETASRDLANSKQAEELISDRLNQENISDQKANKDGHTALKQRVQSQFLLEETKLNVKVDEKDSNLNCVKQDKVVNFGKGSNAISFKNQERGPSKVMKGKWIVKLERINVSQIIWEKNYELCS